MTTRPDGLFRRRDSGLVNLEHLAVAALWFRRLPPDGGTLRISVEHTARTLGLGIATVYRTLGELTAAGIVERLTSAPKPLEIRILDRRAALRLRARLRRELPDGVLAHTRSPRTRKAVRS